MVTHTQTPERTTENNIEATSTRWPYPWLRMVAGIIVIFLLGFGVLWLLGHTIQSRPAPVAQVPGTGPPELHNPNITGRFVSEAKQIKVELAAIDEELSGLKDHRQQLATTLDRHQDSDDAELPKALTGLLSYVDQRLTKLRLEKAHLAEQLHELESGTSQKTNK